MNDEYHQTIENEDVGGEDEREEVDELTRGKKNTDDGMRTEIGDEALEEEDENVDDIDGDGDSDEGMEEEEENSGADDDDDDDDDDEDEDDIGDVNEEDVDSDEDQEEKPIKNCKKQRYHTPKIFQDAITVFIPLDVTADLKIAIKKTRAKRITSIYKRFPSLLKEAKKIDEKNSLKDDDDPMVDDDEEENAKEKDDKQPPNKRKRPENVPQPDQFGSVLDYLEAKYVKGVMLEDEDDAPILDDKSEGQGSVYSKDSFLDDTDLQRDVAEQVMASTTLTKLELEHEDGDFFVNVGTLEVENDDYGENYDPLQDKENKTTKKRKKSSTTVASTKTSKTTDASTPAQKTKKTKTEQQNKKKEPTSAKSKKSTVSTASTKSKKTKDKALKLAAKKSKSHSDSLFKKASAMIKKLTAEELPRLKTKLKVALKCPKNKKPGDDITFANPHTPGQKLRVKVPKDCFPGGTFKVTVPVKHRPADTEKDRNKLSRELQEALDIFGKAYDEWCTAQSKVDSSFETFKEKQGKFDKLAKLFPSNLVTPIDDNYLKQVVRRARQNKYKRSKTAAAKNDKESVKEEPVVEDDIEEESTKEESDEEEDRPQLKKDRIVNIPTTGANFPSRTFSAVDFVLNS